MAKKRMKNFDKTVDCTRMVDTVVDTVDGLEKVHINLATGEITYGPDVCINEELMRQAFLKEGVELEDVEEK